MKALVVHQPYAQLIAEGHKRIETRDYPAPRSVVGERIAIVAGKSTESMPFLSDPAWDRLLQGVVPGGPQALRERCAFGVVIATAQLAASEQMDWAFLRRVHEISTQGARERAWGWFGFGRYAWHMADVHLLQTPVPVRGQQRVFNLPGDVAAAVQAQEPQRA